MDYSRTPILRLMTINTLFKPPAERRWRELAAWIAAEGPDIVCLQECRREDGRDVSNWLASSLSGAWFAAFGGVQEGDHRRASGNAVLSRWPIEHEITWDHANPLTPPAYCYDARCDYVFVGAPKVPVGWSSGAREDLVPAGQVTVARIVCDRPLTGHITSDHYGVIAEICWPGRPCS